MGGTSPLRGVAHHGTHVRKTRKHFAFGKLRCIISNVGHRPVNPGDARPLNAARTRLRRMGALACESPAFAAIVLDDAA